MAAIAAPNNKSLVKHQAGNTQNIIQEVIDCYKECNSQVSKYAPSLKASTLLKTCNNVWAAVYDNIRYKIDPPGVQWVRTPARLWSDREGDCKSFSVFIGSCLHQLNIPFAFRFVSFNSDDTPTHVYVVVPQAKGNDIILDAVLPQFNVEKPYTYKKDFKMPTTVTRLSGIGATTQDVAAALAAEYKSLKAAGRVTPVLAFKYNLVYNALLQNGEKIGAINFPAPPAINPQINANTIPKPNTGGTILNSALGLLSSSGGIDVKNILTAGSSAIPIVGPLLSSFLPTLFSIFPGKGGLYNDWSKDGDNGVAEITRWIRNDGDSPKQEALDALRLMQERGFDKYITSTPTRYGDAPLTFQDIINKLQRVGLQNEANQLLQSIDQQVNGNSVNNGFNPDGTPKNTGSNNTLLYLGGAGLLAYFLLKK